MAPKVVILGGGVAGLSAAHELIERGFEVAVYELKPIPGGKARSVTVPKSGVDGRLNLPGEHGFRFFPSFYQNLPDVMKRIPFPGNKQGVFDNLVDATRLEFARFGVKPFVVPARFPVSFADWEVIINDLVHPDLSIPHDEVLFFAERMWRFLTSCKQRLFGEYELMTWWNYLEADNKSNGYRELFVEGLTRSLVASQPTKASARTVGEVFFRLLSGLTEPGVSSDRLLDGPTNDVWINPWMTYLTEDVVKIHPGTIPLDYHPQAKVTSINCQNARIVSATVSEDGLSKDVTADFYIAALPVEVMAGLVTPNMIAADPVFANFDLLKRDVAWMNGIQFYLKQDVAVIHGHVAYLDTPWALTSISQHQFWKNFDLSKYGDGKVQGILSVVISDWTTPGTFNGKAAQDLSNAEEVKIEVYRELVKSLNVGGQSLLPQDPREILDTWFLDPDIVFSGPPGQERPGNLEALFVNHADRWRFRPKALTQIPNLFLASDYVQTTTDVACMEAANEAARLAVNGVLTSSHMNVPPCKIFVYEEPEQIRPLLHFLRGFDFVRWELGKPWKHHGNGSPQN
jgi:uncharacterized protein with NAD-binding domain and iron-sulfur cluster